MDIALDEKPLLPATLPGTPAFGRRALFPHSLLGTDRQVLSAAVNTSSKSHLDFLPESPVLLQKHRLLKLKSPKNKF